MQHECPGKQMKTKNVHYKKQLQKAISVLSKWNVKQIQNFAIGPHIQRRQLFKLQSQHEYTIYCQTKSKFETIKI